MWLLTVAHHWVTPLSLSRIGEGNGNLLQCSCLENLRDRGAWWAAVYGVTQSRTRLKWLSSSSSSRIVREKKSAGCLSHSCCDIWLWQPKQLNKAPNWVILQLQTLVFPFLLPPKANASHWYTIIQNYIGKGFWAREFQDHWQWCWVDIESSTTYFLKT